MASTRNGESLFVLDGRSYPLGSSRSVGARLLEEFAREVVLPSDDEPPYLFCGNGSCRDCNLLVEGFSDVTSCRIPMAPGMSLRSGEGSGEDNVLARKIASGRTGTPIACEVAVVGAGRAGRSSARAFRDRGSSVELFDARAPKPRPVAVFDGRLVAFEDRRRRDIEADTIVLATGARDGYRSFPGSALPGVMPMDLLDRYVALGFLAGSRFLLVGGGNRAVRLERALREMGARDVMHSEAVFAASGRICVERAVLDDREVDVDIVAVAGKRVPSLEIAKALGCRTRYDRERGHDVLELDPSDRTSVGGVLAVGGMVRP